MPADSEEAKCTSQKPPFFIIVLQALRIFVPGIVRALLGHCAKLRFLQVATASMVGELQKAYVLT